MGVVEQAMFCPCCQGDGLAGAPKLQGFCCLFAFVWLYGEEELYSVMKHDDLSLCESCCRGSWLPQLYPQCDLCRCCKTMGGCY